MTFGASVQCRVDTPYLAREEGKNHPVAQAAEAVAQLFK
jgi:hypothetical protein